jgi:uroporphyrinogen-III synthase
MSAVGTLSGMGVLVTRPRGQAESLCRLIEAAGGRPLAVPTIEIQPVADPGPARTLLAQTWDLMVFTSRNAVELALALGYDGTWPGAVRLAAIGRATAAALVAAGRAPELVPVLIVRGEGGRTLLRDVLTQRGAEVRFAEVYRRVRPAVDPAELIARWPTEVGLAIATSDEILLNLVEMLGDQGRDLLTATPLVVISERTAVTARGLGFQSVRVAERADDPSIVKALGELAVNATS